MLKRLMGCLLFFLRPAVSLVWSWRQQCALRLRACRVCRIVRCCLLVVSVGRGRATASVEWRRGGRRKALTAADGDRLCCRRSDEMTSPLSHPPGPMRAAPPLSSLPPSPSLLQTLELRGGDVITNRTSEGQPTAESMWTLVPRV
ncbi:hypothetical protein TcG_09826 [Trypanosoma cruzi]|nr:hypothetical protein TcG_09826 [Trypanosoma cruzi]